MTKINILRSCFLGLLINFIFICSGYCFPYFMAFGSVYKTDSMTGLTIDPDLFTYEQGNKQITGSSTSDSNNTSKEELTETKLSYLNEDALKSSYTSDESDASSIAGSSTNSSSKTVVSNNKNYRTVGSENPANKYPDPYENYNRVMYDINKTIDKFAIKPLAQLYTAILPLPVKHMVTNFFNNIFDITVFLNDLLQAEGQNSADTLGRFTLNSTFGIFGLIDVAKDMGLPKRSNDFGITLGKWGMAPSNYFVIPLFGPSTVRDFMGKGIGFATTYGYYYLPHEYDLPLFALFMLDTRANLLTAEKIIDTVSDDEYIFIRNSYLQYRDALIRGEKIDTKREEYEDNLLSDIMAEQKQTTTKSNPAGNDELDNLDNSKNSRDSKSLDDLDELKDL